MDKFQVKFGNSLVGQSLVSLLGNCTEDSVLYSFLANNIHGQILDLGCNLPEIFYQLYHRFGYTKFVGVDLCKNEYDCLSKWKWKTNPKYHTSSFFENYQRLKANGELAKPLIRTKEEHDKVFTNHIQFNTSLESFLKQTTESFEIITAVNSLHFCDTVEEFENSLRSIRKVQATENFTFLRLGYDKTRNPLSNAENIIEIIKREFRIGYIEVDIVNKDSWKLIYSNQSLTDF